MKRLFDAEAVLNWLRPKIAYHQPVKGKRFSESDQGAFYVLEDFAKEIHAGRFDIPVGLHANGGFCGQYDTESPNLDDRPEVDLETKDQDGYDEPSRLK